MKSLRNQLVLIFSIFTGISLLTALYTSYYYVKKEKISKVSREVVDLQVSLLKAINNQENFYNFDVSSTEYFETGQSDYLDDYNIIFVQLEEKLKQVLENEFDGEGFDQTKEIVSELNEFDSLFGQMVLSIKKRGFKNYGVEGKMREAVHKLESINEVDLEIILMLRRHEKDYILRQDPIYIDRHEQTVQQLNKDIRLSREIADERKEQITEILDDYVALFNEVVFFERFIGLKANTGLKKKIDHKTKELIQLLNKLELHSLASKENLMLKLNYSLGIFWFAYLVVSLSLSIFISNRFTKRLNILSGKINYFVNTNFSVRLGLTPKIRKDEVGVLWNNFIRMEQEIVDYIELFKEKVDEKTHELIRKTERIEIQKKELIEQKEESDRRNKDLLDSMRYAWRIQQALIPTAKRFKKHIKNGFIYFVPKEIVSGDIYWTFGLRKNEEEESIFSVIDCTGHGVPGAFMSILAVNAINFAVLNKEQRSPEKILRATNNYVFNTLKYYNGNTLHNTNKDGMDMLLCKLNRKTKKLEYSGANRPLYLVRKYQDKECEEIGLDKEKYKINFHTDALVFEIKPTKKTVGVLDKKQSSVFENVEIDVREDDMLYLTSDGFADQFGGARNKKFMVSRLKSLMVLIHELDENEQREAIHQTIQDWKGKEDQIDDITIMGIRV